jgi:hypothetical protein
MIGKQNGVSVEIMSMSMLIMLLFGFYDIYGPFLRAISASLTFKSYRFKS